MQKRSEKHASTAIADKAEASGQVIVIREKGNQALWWVIAICLVIIASHLVFQGPDPISSPAFAQSGAGARGVFAFSGPLTKNSYGVYMVDVDTGTIWVYEYVASTKVLRFAAARSWLYDRYLECHNCDSDSESPLTPDAVKELVEMQRAQRMNSRGTETP